MIKSVVREYHWTPHYVNGLFLDEADHLGLMYWYNDVLEIQKELKSLTKK